MQQLAIESNKQAKANSICCYICGRDFGTKGFAFHYKECLLKFSNEQAKKLAKERIKLPDAPEELKLILAGDLSGIDLRKFNEISNSIFKYKVLPSCKYCKRTFNAQSLVVHMKGCSKRPSGYEEKENEIERDIKVPKNLVCCVCGQRFGTASLKIHYPQCIKKFNNEEFRKHKKEADRRKPPEYTPEDLQALQQTQWNQQQMEAFNNRAMQKYRDHGMAECDNCARKFFFQQFDKHRKNCELINGKLNLGKPKPGEKCLKVVAKPKTIVCYICGRQFGTSSIFIHTPQCEQLFCKQQEAKPVGQKKKMPQLSSQVKDLYDISKADEWNKQQIESYNKLAFQCFNNRSLSKCYICQRTFFQQQLPKHLKDCQSKIKDLRKLEKFKKQIKSNQSFFGDNFIENVIRINKQLSGPPPKETRKPRVLMCMLCGRQFGLSSLKIHIPQCRGQSLQKRIQLQGLIQKIKAQYDLDEAQSWSDAQIQSYNKQVYEIYKRSSLFQCKFCHRTFFQESLKKHIKHCQNEQGKKKLRRCQTTNSKIEDKEEDNSELDLSINLNKMSSQKVIIEDKQSLQENNRILQNIDLLSGAMDIQQHVQTIIPQDRAFSQTKPEASECGIESEQNITTNNQVLQVEDF